MKWLCSLVFLLMIEARGFAQTLGGDAAYGFLKLSPSSQLSALGTVNISDLSDDVSLAFHNPALLRETMSGQFSGNFNLFFSGIRNIHAQAAFITVDGKQCSAVA